MRLVIGLVLLAVVALLGYVRLAPSDPTRWHVAIEETEDRDSATGALRVVSGSPETLARFDEIALSTPRTRRLAGTPEEGRVTYVTRSYWMGFPDYTTADLRDGQLRLYSRLRFGQNDLGVNRARLERWLGQL